MLSSAPVAREVNVTKIPASSVALSFVALVAPMIYSKAALVIEVSVVSARLIDIAK